MCASGLCSGFWTDINMPNFTEMRLINMLGIPKTDRKPITAQVRSPDR